MSTTAYDTITFLDHTGRWYAAVSPGYDSRRRARYALKQKLAETGQLDGQRVQLKSAPGGIQMAWPAHEVWTVVLVATRPGG